ncbi:PP2C family protein-serine/threonine phosphatase [Streptomyces sp. NPDC047009]|uniref:PP2C family protein-serine/threonine phosphatase n=1 Tax=Streptomyces sp. NPDC047009 TaxID=3154496 RepID=UPI0033D0A535
MAEALLDRLLGIPRHAQRLRRVWQGIVNCWLRTLPRDERKRRSALAVLPFLAILAITLICPSQPASLHLCDLLIMVPVITAWYICARVTALVGITAAASTVALCAIHHMALPVPQMTALIVTAICSTTCGHVRERRQRELIQVRTVSEAAQLAVLPPLPRHLGPLHTATVYLAAEDEAQVGGDLYAAVRTLTGTRLIIGDVRGKGLTAVGDAARLVGAFREYARSPDTLPELAAELDRSVRYNMSEAVESERDGECFVTAAILEIPDDEPVVRSVTCGHPPPLRLRPNEVMALEASQPAPPLGLAALTRTTYHLDTHGLRADDTLLLYTDGVIEARNTTGVFYPLTERLTTQTHHHPAELLQHIRTDLLTHVGGPLGDDAAIIAIKRQTSNPQQ